MNIPSPFSPSDAARIVEVGPWLGKRGVIQQVEPDKGRVVLFFDHFGQIVPCELEYGSIEKLETDDWDENLRVYTRSILGPARGLLMAFEDVYLVSEKLILTRTAELDELQAWLAAPLPLGYREYMTTLGVGTYCDLMRVVTPERIREARDERREFVREYYEQFWGESESYLGIEEAVTGVYFASTCNGDEVYYLADQQRLFVLPRHNEAVFWLESGFVDPLDWRSPDRDANVYRPPFRYFVPTGGDRRVIEFFTSGSFDMCALAERFRTRWSGQEVRSIPRTESLLLFPRNIRGRVQLTQPTGDPRVGVRVDYDNDCSTEIERFGADLRDLGFFETWRHPIAKLRRCSVGRGMTLFSESQRSAASPLLSLNVPFCLTRLQP